MALQTLLGCSKHPSPEQLCLVSNKITFKRLIPSGLDENLEISMLLSRLWVHQEALQPLPCSLGHGCPSSIAALIWCSCSLGSGARDRAVWWGAMGTSILLLCLGAAMKLRFPSLRLVLGLPVPVHVPCWSWTTGLICWLDLTPASSLQTCLVTLNTASLFSSEWHLLRFCGTVPSWVGSLPYLPCYCPQLLPSSSCGAAHSCCFLRAPIPGPWCYMEKLVAHWL